jgi:ATP synthase F1 complex assembly factor 2
MTLMISYPGTRSLVSLSLSFPTDKPSTAVHLQKAHWEPLHAHLKKTYGVEIISYQDLVLGPGKKFEQKRETREVLRGVVDKWDAWEIAG